MAKTKAKASPTANAIATIAPTTTASSKVHLVDLGISNLPKPGTLHAPVELRLFLAEIGMHTHGSLLNGVKTIGMNRIGLKHGVKVPEGHGDILHLRMTLHLQHRQYRDNHLKHFLILNHQVFELCEVLLH